MLKSSLKHPYMLNSATVRQALYTVTGALSEDDLLCERFSVVTQ